MIPKAGILLDRGNQGNSITIDPLSTLSLMTKALTPSFPTVGLRRSWISASGIFVGVLALTITAANFKKPDYAAEGRLKFTRSTPTASVTETSKEAGKLESLLDQISPLDTEAEVLRSTGLVQPVIQQFKLKNTEGQLLSTTEFLENLKVKPVRSADILAVTYVSRDAEEAAAVVNGVMEVYLQQDILARQAQVRAASQFVEQQLPKVEHQVHLAEQNLRTFQEKNKTIVLDQEVTSAVTQAESLKQQANTLRSTLVDTEAQLQNLRSQLSGIQADPIVQQSMLSQSTALQEALKELNELEMQLALARSRYQGTAPQVAELEGKVNNLRGLVAARAQQALELPSLTQPSQVVGNLYQELTRRLVELESQRQGLQHQIEVIETQRKLSDENLAVLPQLQAEQRDLSRKLEVAQASYSELLKKAEELRIAKGQKVGNAQVLVKAETPEKSVSSKTPIYVAGFLLGLLLAGLWIYLIDARQPAFQKQKFYA